MREIESLETFTLSKWNGNNEDGAGSLWGGGGSSSEVEMGFQGFSLKQQASPMPSHPNLSIFCWAWVYAGEGGESLMEHIYSSPHM